jgi:hypothetical protein
MVDLGREAATRSAERLGVLPPFAPAADTCARTIAQAGKLEHWIGREGVARSRGSEIDVLLKLNSRIASDALMLLLRLRIDHSARCRRGETFNITPKAMVRSDVVHGWTRERYKKARDLLLLAGFIDKVSDFKHTRDGREGAQYRLTTCSEAGAAPIAGIMAGDRGGGGSSYIGA